MLQHPLLPNQPQESRALQILFDLNLFIAHGTVRLQTKNNAHVMLDAYEAGDAVPKPNKFLGYSVRC